MKRVIIIIGIIAAFCIIYILPDEKPLPEPHIDHLALTIKPTQRIVIIQDVSALSAPYVERVSANEISEIFGQTDRKVELNYGIVGSNTHLFITISVPAKHFSRPEKPVESDNIIDQQKVNEAYTKQYVAYAEDSLQYEKSRWESISDFSKSIDSLLAVSVTNVSKAPNVARGLANADKVFMSSLQDNAENILIIESYGSDGFTKQFPPLTNSETILVNTSRWPSPSLHADWHYQSFAQAVQFILSKN